MENHCSFLTFEKKFSIVMVPYLNIIAKCLLSLLSGINTTSEAELKKMTNIMKQDNLHAESLDGKLMLSEGYTWEWNLEIQSRILNPPYP